MVSGCVSVPTEYLFPRLSIALYTV